MKDVLIISNYWHFESEKSSSRYLSIAKLLCKENISLEVVTSSFYHTQKKQREKMNFLDSVEYKISLLHEPGYRKNISVKRIISHKVFTKNVVRYLKERKKPDLIYLFVPPLELGNAISMFAKKNGIKLIIDVLDLWPEAYNMILKNDLLNNAVFYFSKRKANKIYSRADKIVSVSNTYLKRALSVNRNDKTGLALYIGTELNVFDQFRQEKQESNQIIIVYIGMLGHSYDLKCAIEAMSLLNSQGYKNLKLLVMGDGPLLNSFKEYASKLNICSEFTGRLEYSEMVRKLCNCDIALNVISKGAVQSIINKHSDYLAAGLPIINNQEVPEFGEIIEKYRCGVNCINSDSQSLANALQKLIDDPVLRREMGRNSRFVAEELFDRNNTYSQITNLIMSLLDN